MNKKTVEKIVNAIPQSLKNVVGYVKESFDESGQDALSNSTGTIGVLVKLFAQGPIDSYFDTITKGKLEDFGSNIYLVSALKQAGRSLEAIEGEVEESSLEDIKLILVETLTIEDSTFKKDDVLTIFTPQYHPTVVFIKEKITLILSKLNIPNKALKSFTRNFNENIELTIKETFGESDYEKHLSKVKDYRLEEGESKLLHDMHKLNHIGFKENENLKYEETFSEWSPVSSLFSMDYHHDDSEIKEIETSKKDIESTLVLAKTLIEEHFERCTKNSHCLGSILFTIADFGKGKSVFLKQYASELAKQFSKTKEGFFPVYFNLRNFSSYSSDGKLGVLGDYLLQEYAIKIDNEYFKKRKYLFLVDSLDESGELTKSAIDKVINSIKSIQNIDKELCRQNRIVISSRPFSDGLSGHLSSHEPFTIQNDREEDVPQFISIYGFKEKQFNSWLYNSLKKYEKISDLSATGFAKNIIKNVKKGKTTNIYVKLLDEKTLSKSELRRPIFAYMIYQLIINDVDFYKIGKIGIYLSFINLLTKEAKHMDDMSYQTDLREEVRFRNILHSISALWMYERQQGQQGILKKADICRVLDEEDRDETDREILERYKKEGVTDIQFLSHSYFGENNNVLHFQHQSFAEILLAEYYLKVFIKYALDKKLDVEKARAKLVLGEPTEQTVLFFKELIQLLKDTVSDKFDQVLIEKRKLLYPLLASLATEKHNTLYSDDLYYDWYKTADSSISSSSYPNELLEEWAITKEKLDKIVDLASNIINSNSSVILSKSETRNSLFKNELTILQNKSFSDLPTDIDKWLALVLGNIIKTNIEKSIFFNKGVYEYKNFFEMIRNWNYSANKASPAWAKKYFQGIDMGLNNSVINVKNLDFSNLDFSYSHFNKLNMNGTNLEQSSFNNCIFDGVQMTFSKIIKTTFKNIDLNKRHFHIGFSMISYNVLFPIKLANSLLNYGNERNSRFFNQTNEVTFLSISEDSPMVNDLKNIFDTLEGFILYGLKNKMFTKQDVKTWFNYSDDSVRTKFEGYIDSLVS